MPGGYEFFRRADMIVSAVVVRGRCPAAHSVIDRFDPWRMGGHALWLEEKGRIRIESVRTERGERPWVAKLETRRRQGRTRRARAE